VFAPEGFISLDEIECILDDIAWEWRLATPHRDDPSPGGFLEADTFDFVDDAGNRHVAYRKWLFQSFLNRHERNLYACSSNGKPLKLSMNLVSRFKLFDGPFLDTRKDWDSIISHLDDYFNCISCHGYTISVEQARKWNSEETFSKIRATLEIIDALPVCWKLPRDTDAISWLKVCGVDERQRTLPSDMSVKSISERILAVKNEAPTMTRADVREVVAPTISFGLYRLAWSAAAQKEPWISKPGRKS
jgi:hypothetical protein